LKFGIYSFPNIVLNVTNSSNSSQVESNPISVSFINGFCKSGPAGGNLSIDRVKITGGSGSDARDWKPLDQIEVEVKVSNNGDQDSREVFVNLGLFDDSGNQRIGDVSFNKSDEDSISLGTVAHGKFQNCLF